MSDGTRRRLGLVLSVAAVLLAGSFLARAWPKDREVRYLLGSRAASVVELDAAWSDEKTGDEVRQASFRYELGHAPRAVVHTPSLTDGRYAIAIQVVTEDGAGPRRTTRITEHVDLTGPTLSFDLGLRLAQSEALGALGPRRSAERRE
jgi:hypothetical protein